MELAGSQAEVALSAARARSSSPELSRVLLALLLVSSCASPAPTGSNPSVAPASCSITGPVPLRVGGFVAELGVSYVRLKGTVETTAGPVDLELSGFGLAGVGLTHGSGGHRVRGLCELSDIEGNYFAVHAGLTIGPGITGIHMVNGRGVSISISILDNGLHAGLGALGLSVRLR